MNVLRKDEERALRRPMGDTYRAWSIVPIACVGDQIP